MIEAESRRKEHSYDQEGEDLTWRGGSLEPGGRVGRPAQGGLWFGSKDTVAECPTGASHEGS